MNLIVDMSDMRVAFCSKEMIVMDSMIVMISAAEVAMAGSSKLAELSRTRAVSLVIREVVLSEILEQSSSN